MRITHLLLALFLLAFSSCKKDSDDPEPTPTPTPVPQQVTYRIICSDCQVFYYKAGMVQANEYHVNSSWSYSFDGVKGDVVMLMAYNTSNAPQGVNATILVDNDTLCSQTNFCPISGYSFVTDTLE